MLSHCAERADYALLHFQWLPLAHVNKWEEVSFIVKIAYTGRHAPALRDIISDLIYSCQSNAQFASKQGDFTCGYSGDRVPLTGGFPAITSKGKQQKSVLHGTSAAGQGQMTPCHLWGEVSYDGM